MVHNENFKTMIDKTKLNFIRIKINKSSSYYNKTVNGSTGGEKYIDNVVTFKIDHSDHILGISKHNSNIECLVRLEDKYTINFLKSKGFEFQNEFVFPDDLDKITPLENVGIETAESLEFTGGAKQLIEENTTIDFSKLVGTGKGGKVTKKDVEEFIKVA